MTEQEKSELARQLKDNIEDLVSYLAAHPNSMDACDVRWRIRIGSIALASLTAPPVKLPDRYDIGSMIDVEKDDDGPLYLREDIIEAIRAAGYEVVE